MRIVVDTNVVISGIFFGGNPRKIIESIVDDAIDSFATTEIIDEYMEIIESMIKRKRGSFDQRAFSPLFSSLNIINSETEIEMCRDPDDDKFIECAVDAKALYIVSGDKDLTDLGQHAGIPILKYSELLTKLQ